jgi:hypothetical protein
MYASPFPSLEMVCWLTVISLPCSHCLTHSSKLRNFCLVSAWVDAHSRTSVARFSFMLFLTLKRAVWQIFLVQVHSSSFPTLWISSVSSKWSSHHLIYSKKFRNSLLGEHLDGWLLKNISCWWAFPCIPLPLNDLFILSNSNVPTGLDEAPIPSLPTLLPFYLKQTHKLTHFNSEDRVNAHLWNIGNIAHNHIA